MRWDGHVASNGQTKLSYKNMLGEDDERKPQL